MMVVVDVALANIWMAVLLILAGHSRRMDAAVGADRTALEDLGRRTKEFQKTTQRSATVAELCAMLFLAFGSAAIAAQSADWLTSKAESWLSPIRPLSAGLGALNATLGPFGWTVVLVTTVGVLISFSRLRRLEGAGASRIGSVFLYLLVASIGAKAEFAKVLEMPGLLVIGAVWLAVHAAILLLLWWALRAPLFYMAVGSQANIGGAASAPIVAGAFDPSLAPIGALMGVAGYVLGTYAGFLCAALMKLVYATCYAG
jgi:uncharacterized membrane protein